MWRQKIIFKERVLVTFHAIKEICDDDNTVENTGFLNQTLRIISKYSSD